MTKSVTYFFFCLILVVCIVFFYNSAISAKETELDSQIISTGKCSYSLTLTTSASKEVIWQLWEDVENWKSYDTVLTYSYLQEGSSFWNTIELKRRVEIVGEGKVEFTHEVDFKGPLKGLMYSLLAKRFKKDLKMVMVNMKDIAEAK